MNRRQLLLALLSLPLLPVAKALGPFREPIVGLPCEGCEAVFKGQPDMLSSRVRIAPLDEPGEPLTLMGRVTDREGRSRAGIIIYAYHTDRTGIYPPPVVSTSKAAGRHGRLRAWARTDARGEYRFDTIRPGSYPGQDIPQHIHMHVIEPGRATYYIDDVMFRDDPKLTSRIAKRLSNGRGGGGMVKPEQRNGMWLVRRDIVLGLGVPGYPAGALE